MRRRNGVAGLRSSSILRCSCCGMMCSFRASSIILREYRGFTPSGFILYVLTSSGQYSSLHFIIYWLYDCYRFVFRVPFCGFPGGVLRAYERRSEAVFTALCGLLLLMYVFICMLLLCFNRISLSCVLLPVAGCPRIFESC